jgi:hypothetical protein
MCRPGMWLIPEVRSVWRVQGTFCSVSVCVAFVCAPAHRLALLLLQYDTTGRFVLAAMSSACAGFVGREEVRPSCTGVFNCATTFTYDRTYFWKAKAFFER